MKMQTEIRSKLLISCPIGSVNCSAQTPKVFKNFRISALQMMEGRPKAVGLGFKEKPRGFRTRENPMTWRI